MRAKFDPEKVGSAIGTLIFVVGIGAALTLVDRMFLRYLPVGSMVHGFGGLTWPVFATYFGIPTLFVVLSDRRDR